MNARSAVFNFAMAMTISWLAQGIARADSIGDVVSVVPTANYQRGGTIKELQINGLVEQNDKVVTTSDGLAYIHFIDDTVLTIGANSEVMLDKFVFDGDKAKTVNIQLVRGTLRFVTGTSDHSAYQIKTPVASIGVRGTTIDLSYENDRMVYNTVEGLGVVCHTSAGCQNIRAGASPIALTRGGFFPATAAESARMLNNINRAHNILAQRIGRNPNTMLAFAKSRGPNFARGLGGQKGLDQKGAKGLDQKSIKALDEKDKKATNRKGLKDLFKGKKSNDKKTKKLSDKDDQQENTSKFSNPNFDRSFGGGLLRRK
jgi:hypothetical protein